MFSTPEPGLCQAQRSVPSVPLCSFLFETAYPPPDMDDPLPASLYSEIIRRYLMTPLVNAFFFGD